MKFLGGLIVACLFGIRAEVATDNVVLDILYFLDDIENQIKKANPDDYNGVSQTDLDTCASYITAIKAYLDSINIKTKPGSKSSLKISMNEKAPHTVEIKQEKMKTEDYSGLQDLVKEFNRKMQTLEETWKLIVSKAKKDEMKQLQQPTFTEAIKDSSITSLSCPQTTRTIGKTEEFTQLELVDVPDSKHVAPAPITTDQNGPLEKDVR